VFPCPRAEAEAGLHQNGCSSPQDGQPPVSECFTRIQPGKWEPYRFEAEQIGGIFGDCFDLLAVKETVYQGTLNPLPRALFCVLRMNPVSHNDPFS
jgi:hypothetical protein